MRQQSFPDANGLHGAGTDYVNGRSAEQVVTVNDHRPIALGSRAGDFAA
jgi:hypothetical protein